MRKPPDIPIDDESDPSSIDMSSLTYLGLWGGAAAVALLMVASATMSETGQRRLATFFGGASMAPQAAAIEGGLTAAGDADIRSRRLADQLRNLSEDRDRLLARVTVLERNYEDVTGIGRRVLRNRRADRRTCGSRTRSAGLSVRRRRSHPAFDRRPLLTKTEFGVDIGGAPSVAALRAAWDRIRRNHIVQLEGLRPVIGVREGQTGQVELRLVVGPIDNAAAAARLCATLANAGLVLPADRPSTGSGWRCADLLRDNRPRRMNSRPLFAPTARQTNWLIALGLVVLGYATICATWRSR